MSDKFHEECAVMGVYGHPEAANMVYLGLYALQHRGQESCGIVSSDGTGLHLASADGPGRRRFQRRMSIKRLEAPAPSATTATRLPGSSALKNAQPIIVEYAQGTIAFAHNGNLVNAASAARRTGASGSIFQSTTDTEVIVHLIATSKAGTLRSRSSKPEPGRGRLLLAFAHSG